jgi:hypothetical protein
VLLLLVWLLLPLVLLQQRMQLPYWVQLQLGYQKQQQQQQQRQ